MEPPGNNLETTLSQHWPKSPSARPKKWKEALNETDDPPKTSQKTDLVELLRELRDVGSKAHERLEIQADSLPIP